MVEWTWKQWTWASTSRSTLMQGAEANKLRSASGAPTPHRSPASLSKNKLGTQWNQFSGDTETQDMGEPTSASPSPSTRPCRSPVSRICSASTRCLGEGGGKVSRPCARLLTTCKMLSRNISFDTRAVSVSPPLPDPRTLSNAIWHLASAGSMLTHAALWHPRESGPTIRRGPSIGIHFTQANSAANSNNIRGRAGGRILTTAPPYASLDEKRSITICTATSAGLRKAGEYQTAARESTWKLSRQCPAAPCQHVGTGIFCCEFATANGGYTQCPVLGIFVGQSFTGLLPTDTDCHMIFLSWSRTGEPGPRRRPQTGRRSALCFDKSLRASHPTLDTARPCWPPLQEHQEKAGPQDGCFWPHQATPRKGAGCWL